MNASPGKKEVVEELEEMIIEKVVKKEKEDKESEGFQDEGELNEKENV